MPALDGLSVVDLIDDHCRGLTVEAFVSRLDAFGVPCGRVRSVGEALADPQVQARQMLVTRPHHTLGQIQSIGNPMRLSTSPPVYRSAAAGAG